MAAHGTPPLVPVPSGAEVWLQEELTDRAKQKNPNAQHVSVGNFMNAPQYDEVVEQLKNQ